MTIPKILDANKTGLHFDEYWSRNTLVYLDGRLISHVTYADSEEGYLIRVKTDENGMLLTDAVDFDMERLNGKVEFKPRDPLGAAVHESGASFDYSNRPVKTLQNKLSALSEVLGIATANGNAKANEYMRGMANGLILAHAIMNDIEPAYIDSDPEA